MGKSSIKSKVVRLLLGYSVWMIFLIRKTSEPDIAKRAGKQSIIQVSDAEANKDLYIRALAWSTLPAALAIAPISFMAAVVAEVRSALKRGKSSQRTQRFDQSAFT
jgi:hypothetical protein